MNVFIVEDSEDVRERLASLLHDIANLHIIGQASDASAAMEEFSRLMRASRPAQVSSAPEGVA